MNTNVSFYSWDIRDLDRQIILFLDNGHISIKPLQNGKQTSFEHNHGKDRFLISPLLGTLKVLSEDRTITILSNPGNSISTIGSLNAINISPNTGYFLEVLCPDRSCSVSIAESSVLKKRNKILIPATRSKTNHIFFGSHDWTYIQVKDDDSLPSMEKTGWRKFGLGEYMIIEQDDGDPEQYVFFGVENDKPVESTKTDITVVKVHH